MIAQQLIVQPAASLFRMQMLQVRKQRASSGEPLRATCGGDSTAASQVWPASQQRQVGEWQQAATRRLHAIRRQQRAA